MQGLVAEYYVIEELLQNLAEVEYASGNLGIVIR